jgi:choline dehydrogenase-like flavoprotein
MISDHFRVHNDRRERPTFMIFSSPAMDWFPIGNEATSWATESDKLSIDALVKSVPHMATLSAMTELGGNGALELERETLDAFGSPVAKVNMKLSDWDLRGSSQLAELAPKIGDAMSAVHVSEVTPPEFGMGYHPSGATAMAEAPDDGVCDPNLTVFGLENLHLASNSVFPHMGANPPTLTIAALALRLAAHLEAGGAR